MSSPFENASERLSALMERASGLLEDIEDTPSPAERAMGAETVEAEPLRLLREAIELNRAQLEAFREYSRRYDEELSEQRRNAAVQAEQSRKVNILSLAIAALSLVFAIAAVLAPQLDADVALVHGSLRFVCEVNLVDLSFQKNIVPRYT